MTQFLLDSHCHLADSDFDSDREQVIERARAAGVQSFVVIGTGASYPETGKALTLAEQQDGAYAAAGIHPHEARHFLASALNELRQFARHPKFLALGEMGLD
ncbi:MAG TPA: TatD family hydrolase, partial [Terriglobia bacterium]|nr:TatD family hydrolase [Terriglobia bacterium]